MNTPSDELLAIRQELEQFRQDFTAYRKDLPVQIRNGILGGVLAIILIGIALQIVAQLFSAAA